MSARGVWEKSEGHTLGGVPILLTKFLFVSCSRQNWPRITLEMAEYGFRYESMLKLHKTCSSLFSMKFAFSWTQLQPAHPCWTVHVMAGKIFHMHGNMDFRWIGLLTALNMLEMMFLIVLVNN